MLNKNGAGKTTSYAIRALGPTLMRFIEMFGRYDETKFADSNLTKQQNSWL